MCFSAEVSFGAATILTAAGVAGVNSLKKGELKERKGAFYLSLIPFVFAIQQFSEGILWLFIDIDFIKYLFSAIFLFFAFLFWPFYFSFSLLRMEPDEKKRKAYKILTGLGIFSALYFATIVAFTYSGTNIVGKHILYELEVPFLWFSGPLYTLICVVAALISSYKWVRLFGIMLALSIGISLYFYTIHFTSVWCFFGAVLSLIFVCQLRDRKKRG